MEIIIPKKIIECWSSYKNKFNKKSKNTWESSSDILVNNLYWVVPEEVIWLYATNNEEDYDDCSQTQIGVTKEGKIVWGFFSHCSCYGYEDYKGDFEELKEDNLIHTEKYYEMENVDKNVLKLLKDRLNEISKIGLKDIKEVKAK
jgi:hypothetical protein